MNRIHRALGAVTRPLIHWALGRTLILKTLRVLVPQRIHATLVNRVENNGWSQYSRPNIIEHELDDAPPSQPFPDVLFAFITSGIPPTFGGRTSSILAKMKAFDEQAGADCLLLTVNHSTRLAAVVRTLRNRGLIGSRVRFLSIFDAFAGVITDTTDTYPTPERITRFDFDIDGLRVVRTTNQTRLVCSYFDANDRLVLRRTYDDSTWFLLDEPDLRLLTQEHFTDQRCASLEHYDENGYLRFTTYFDLATGKRNREVYFRADSSIYMEQRFNQKSAELTHAVLFNDKASVVFEAQSLAELMHRYFDLVFENRPVILSIEDRARDLDSLTYRRDNVKRVFVFHGPHVRPPFTNPKMISDNYRNVFRHLNETDAVVFLTPGQRADAVAAVGAHPEFAVIPHPVAVVPQDTSVAPEANLIVMVSRLDSQKRVDHVINAFARVVVAVPDARLEIYGLGPSKSLLSDLISTLSLTDNVRLMGFTTNVSIAFQRAAASVLTSRYEGLPLVILESLANGCPVVAYDVPYGAAATIRDEVNGFLVPPGSVDALAERLIQILDDAELRDNLRAQARSTIASFAPEVWLARWSDLFGRINETSWSSNST